jgi:tripeptide aminopeptidase
MRGTIEEAKIRLRVRDHNEKNNKRRMEFLQKLKDIYEFRYPGLKIELKFEHEYSNMLKFIEKERIVVNLAKEAIKMAGLEVKIEAIRGGTDGSKLSEMGIPTGGSYFILEKSTFPL